MKAAVFESFRTPIQVQQVPDPQPHPDSAIIAVKACGLCRSDWHGWMGHDSDVHLPHVPGHELAGIVRGQQRAAVEGRAASHRTILLRLRFLFPVHQWQSANLRLLHTTRLHTVGGLR
jgi:alcohol dehydrogenase